MASRRFSIVGSLYGVSLTEGPRGGYATATIGLKDARIQAVRIIALDALATELKTLCPPNIRTMVVATLEEQTNRPRLKVLSVRAWTPQDGGSHFTEMKEEVPPAINWRPLHHIPTEVGSVATEIAVTPLGTVTRVIEVSEENVRVAVVLHLATGDQPLYRDTVAATAFMRLYRDFTTQRDAFKQEMDRLVGEIRTRTDTNLLVEINRAGRQIAA